MAEISKMMKKNSEMLKEQNEIEEKTQSMKNTLEELQNDIKNSKEEYNNELDKMENLQTWHNKLVQEIYDLDKNRLELKIQNRKEKNELYNMTPNPMRRTTETIHFPLESPKTPLPIFARSNENVNLDNVK